MRTMGWMFVAALVASCAGNVTTGTQVGPDSPPGPIPAYDASATTTVVKDVLQGGNIRCPASAELDIDGNGDWTATGTPLGCNGTSRTAHGHLTQVQLGALLQAAVTPSTGVTAFMNLPERSGGPPIGDVGGEIITVTLKSGSHSVEGNGAPPEFNAYRSKVASATVDLHTLEQAPSATATP